MPRTALTAEQKEAARARRREYNAARYAANRDKRREQFRKCKLQARFNLHPAQYSAMAAGQGHGCALCGSECQTGRRLAVDHDHGSGFVRGLLCVVCNTGLGKFMDSPELLRKAADYLEAGGTQAFDIVTFAQEMAP